MDATSGINKPSNGDEAGLCSSGKHRRYGTKIKGIIDTDGAHVHVPKPLLGSFHDKRIWGHMGLKHSVCYFRIQKIQVLSDPAISWLMDGTSALITWGVLRCTDIGEHDEAQK